MKIKSLLVSSVLGLGLLTSVANASITVRERNFALAGAAIGYFVGSQPNTMNSVTQLAPMANMYYNQPVYNQPVTVYTPPRVRHYHTGTVVEYGAYGAQRVYPQPVINPYYVQPMPNVQIIYQR